MWNCSDITLRIADIQRDSTDIEKLGGHTLTLLGHKTAKNGHPHRSEGPSKREATFCMIALSILAKYNGNRVVQSKLSYLSKPPLPLHKNLLIPRTPLTSKLKGMPRHPFPIQLFYYLKRPPFRPVVFSCYGLPYFIELHRFYCIISIVSIF
ncbi:Uncharacterised protein [Sporosarcina pasteurii]|uniref:Uncharacterized protein n=1 Tax=Sporosarcina pasteurii TaxID=1474 RepID=A0A380BDT3_SPOPA|nr:Uncharacterised protein [Sporosarcina pasteurii]